MVHTSVTAKGMLKISPMLIQRSLSASFVATALISDSAFAAPSLPAMSNKTQ